MRSNEEFKAEIYSRKENYIRKRNQRRLAAASVCAVLALSAAVLTPVILSGNKTPSGENNVNSPQATHLVGCVPHQGNADTVLLLNTVKNGKETTVTASDNSNVTELYVFLKKFTEASGDKAEPTPTPIPTPTPTPTPIPTAAPTEHPTLIAPGSNGGLDYTDEVIGPPAGVSPTYEAENFIESSDSVSTGSEHVILTFNDEKGNKTVFLITDDGIIYDNEEIRLTAEQKEKLSELLADIERSQR